MHTVATTPQYRFAPPPMIEPLLRILCVLVGGSRYGRRRAFATSQMRGYPLNASALLGYCLPTLGFLHLLLTSRPDVSLITFSSTYQR